MIHYHIGVIPYRPLAGGFLTGKYRQGALIPSDWRLSRPATRYGEVFTEANWSTLAKLEAFATERGHNVGELAIAWLLTQPWISTVIAGARRIEQVSANVTAAQWKLTAEEAAAVAAMS